MTDIRNDARVSAVSAVAENQASGERHLPSSGQRQSAIERDYEICLRGGMSEQDFVEVIMEQPVITKEDLAVWVAGKMAVDRQERKLLGM
jgi:hypothetical protein